MGDGVLAEFGTLSTRWIPRSTSSEEWRSETPTSPQDQRIDIRIGINLGEVIVEGADRHGEGVNIAARLQQLADAGGICVSGKVANEVERNWRSALSRWGSRRSRNQRAHPGLSGEARRRARPAKAYKPQVTLSGFGEAVAAAMVFLAGVAAAGWYGLMRSPSHLAGALPVNRGATVHDLATIRDPGSARDMNTIEVRRFVFLESTRFDCRLQAGELPGRGHSVSTSPSLSSAWAGSTRPGRR